MTQIYYQTLAELSIVTSLMVTQISWKDLKHIFVEVCIDYCIFFSINFWNLSNTRVDSRQGSRFIDFQRNTSDEMGNRINIVRNLSVKALCQRNMS